MPYLQDAFAGSQGSQLSAHTADSTHTWAEHASQTTGAVIIDANRIRSNSTATVTYVSSAAPSSMVQWLDADLVITAAGAAHSARFATHQDPTQLTGYLGGVIWDGSTDVAQISKRVNNATETVLATGSLGVLAAGTYKLKFVAMPFFQALLLNGDVVAASGDSGASLTTARLGMLWSGNSSHYRFDNLNGKWTSSNFFTASSNAPAIAVPADAQVNDHAVVVFTTIGSLKPPIPTSPGTGIWAPVQDFPSSTPNSSGTNSRAFVKRLTAADLGANVTSAVGGTANNVVAHITVIPDLHATRPVTTNIWERNVANDGAFSVNGNPVDSAHKFDVPYEWGWDLTTFAARLAAANAALTVTPPADMVSLRVTTSPDTRSAMSTSLVGRLVGIQATVTGTLSAASTQKAGLRVLARPAECNSTPIVGLRDRLEFTGVQFNLQPTLGSDTVAYGTATTLDFDGDVLSPTWSQVGTTPAVVTIAKPNTWAPLVSLPSNGIYTFQLAVADAAGATASGTCLVEAVAEPGGGTGTGFFDGGYFSPTYFDT